jgi:hypothetical protein
VHRSHDLMPKIGAGAGHEVSGDKAEHERDKGDQSGHSHLFDTIPMERDGVEVI